MWCIVGVVCVFVVFFNEESNRSRSTGGILFTFKFTQQGSATATKAVVGSTFHIHCCTALCIQVVNVFFLANFIFRKSAILRSSRLCLVIFLCVALEELRHKVLHHQSASPLVCNSLRPPPLPTPRGDSPLDVEVLTVGDFPGRSRGSQDLLFDPELNVVQARAIALEAASSKTGQLGSPLDLDGYRAYRAW